MVCWLDIQKECRGFQMIPISEGADNRTFNFDFNPGSEHSAVHQGFQTSCQGYLSSSALMSL